MAGLKLLSWAHRDGDGSSLPGMDVPSERVSAGNDTPARWLFLCSKAEALPRSPAEMWMQAAGLQGAAWLLCSMAPLSTAWQLGAGTELGAPVGPPAQRGLMSVVPMACGDELRVPLPYSVQPAGSGGAV